MRRRAWVGAIAMLLATTAAAEPLSREAVPEPLRPWVDWVLHGHERERCVPLLGETDRRECAWPASLALTLDDAGGRFTQEWTVEHDSWVPLPGAETPWPQDVTVDGAPAVVVADNGTPHIRLAPGRHRVDGAFRWTTLPELVPVPPHTGLLTLTLRGAPVPFPERDAQGRLWLQRREPPGDTRDQLGLIVHRLLDDDVPLQLDTRLRLEVSGKAREVLLGPALPAGFVAMALHAPLPARIEADGRLRVQVRPGRWDVQIAARRDTPAGAIAAPTPTDAWAAHEVWVFRAHPELRLVTLDGPPAIDPQQTELPPEWRSLPAYLLAPGEQLTLVERRRGDVDAPPDQLSLARTLWLDFDGGGYTVHDRITGTLTRAWRLEMAPPTLLGRVAVDGHDQFVTRLAADGPAGVEVRAGALTLDADSRLDGARTTLPAVGWQHDFQALTARLQLPPGWRLLHATGVDAARPTWVATWTLLDLFIVLVTALATARLFGWPWGLLALVAVGLSYTESDAPRAIWLAVLAAEALVRVVPDGSARRVLQLARLAATVLLVIVTVPFLVAQVRLAIYPALEHPYYRMEPTAEPETAAPAIPDELHQDAVSDSGFAAPAAKRVMAGATPGPGLPGRSYEYAAIDPHSVVQTGPGLPAWQWDVVLLDWSGPVDAAQQLTLYLLSPAVNAVLAIVRVLLLALLVARLAWLGVTWWPAARVAPAAALALLALLADAPAARAELPSDSLLGALRARLLEPPECHPWCAAMPRMRLEVDAERLRALLEVDVASPTAVPLPGQAQHWVPARVLVDDEPATALLQGADGIVWLRLDAGRHRVLIEGALPQRDTVQLPLRLVPGYLETEVSGWTLHGVHGDGRAEANLQLDRLAPLDGARAASLEPDQLPPFARIERTIRLGLTWQVETRVTRLTPPDAALVLSVPLLPGESVTTAGVRVVDGRAQVNLTPATGAMGWQSTLAERSPLVLDAPTGVAWVEVWQLDASPIWHVEPGGIPPVLRADASAPSLREWRPWPGESVTLDIVRPAGVAGQTLTIDASSLWVRPGLRATDGLLELTVRSSRGTQHALRLPPTAELLSLKIDGSEQPIRQEAGAVVLALNPGTQRVALQWREPDGVGWRFRSPAIDLDAPSVNAHVQIAVPPSRWILFAGGPRLGPAVLFWSLLPVLALVAIGLGRVPATPLRARQWFLLGIGLTQVPIEAAVLVAGWLLALGWRQRRGAALGSQAFDLMQLMLAGWTLVAISILFYAIQQGLLGAPDMQIAGNGSSAALLRWYQDRSAAVLPQAWVISAPLFVYRLLMLAWALWIAQALLRWLRWGWEAFGTGGYWRPLLRKVKVG